MTASHDTRAYAERITLDPGSDENWQSLRALGHRMLDDLFDAHQALPYVPAWRPLPATKAELFSESGPEVGLGPDMVYDQFRSHVFPYGNGNWHPRFFGWVQGTGTPLAMLADMLASGMNPHLAGFNQAPAKVEQQVIGWFAEWMGMPGASGLFVTGGTMANVHGLACARMAMAARLGRDARKNGVQTWPDESAPAPLVFYGSTETHSWAKKAAEWLGLGDRAFRRVAVGPDRRIDMDALARRIAEDRAQGLVPFCVIGTAGTVNTGTTDPLEAIADFCARESLWFHVDGAFGALLALSPRHRHVVRGVERADSLAFDLHKWGSMPFECAVALVRDADTHAAAFKSEAAYLGALPRGVSAGGQRFNDIGLDLTRGFKALKIWMQLKADGVAKLGAVIDQNIEQVQYLARMVDAHAECERVAEAPLNVLCFRYVPSDTSREFTDNSARETFLNDVNREILMRVQEQGIAVPSSTVLDGRFVLRVAHVNHRTTDQDIETLFDAIVEIGREVVSGRD
ncbi:MAG: amino acid decarboxylase [Gemmatimonadaceae bacterium]|nr:amino acid decarboxylase [Gemmatimonadaceae bacterium]